VQDVVEKTVGQCPLGRSLRRLENDIKMDLKDSHEDEN
jgi:hypothetical protein